jgi:N-acetylneuraminate synthase
MNFMNKVLIIAEAGVNHNGSLELAKQLVDKALEAGVDYVKFQAGVPELVASKFAQKAEYQKATTGEHESQLDMIRKITLTPEQQRQLAAYCREAGAHYLCTPFDLPSIELLQELGMKLWKVPSGEITNYPYLKVIAQTGLPVIMSTGMADMKDIEEALGILVKYGTPKDKITLLHCTTEYPAPKDEVNLRAMNALKEYFGVEIGYSDHTQGIEIPIAAVAMGARVIEKHFTLDRNMEGPDHKASLEPHELKNMVECIRNVENALGDGIKRVAASELKNKAIARKSIVAFRNIAAGEVFSEENLITKRPANGLSPMMWEEVIGKVAKRDFLEDEPIEL